MSKDERMSEHYDPPRDDVSGQPYAAPASGSLPGGFDGTADWVEIKEAIHPDDVRSLPRPTVRSWLSWQLAKLKTWARR